MFSNQTLRPATQKQVDLITRLAKERQHPEGSVAEIALADARFEWTSNTGLTRGTASDAISMLLDAPRVEQVATDTDTEPEDGIYLAAKEDGEGSRIFKVYKMVHGSGRQGLKRLDVGEHGAGEFEYVGLASRHLPADARRMTLSEAAAFGRLYGVCVRCGRTLTDEGSIAAGIGPVCAQKGWGA